VIGGNGYTGSFGYIIPLCLLTGLFILRWDVKGYETSSMGKEKKVAGIVGWINVWCGILLFVGNWIFNRWG